MYNLSLLSLGGYAVDTPAELERGYFYHSSAQKRSFDAAFCQLDSFPLPNKAFKEECALLAAIDNNDWVRSRKSHQP